jgi:hypothetical protein
VSKETYCSVKRDSALTEAANQLVRHVICSDQLQSLHMCSLYHICVLFTAYICHVIQ